MKNCQWCKNYNKPCGGKGVNCDFKSLPYTKQAILVRLNEEAKRVAKIKQELLVKVDKRLFEVMIDIVNGMQIMVVALKRDFEMTDSEIQECVVVEKTTIRQRLKLKLKLLAMAQKAKREEVRP